MAHAPVYTDLSPRELAFQITDEGSFSVSESTIYRILKREGPPRELPTIVPAAREYQRQIARVNELWQTDLTDMVLPNCGQYPVGGVLDNFSRFGGNVLAVENVMGIAQSFRRHSIRKTELHWRISPKNREVFTCTMPPYPRKQSFGSLREKH